MRKAFWIFTIGLIGLLVLPLLVQDGMFLDGLLYTTCAKNLAEGIGSFWAPHYSETWGFDGYTPFLEHPPLIYWIQSWFFKLFGSSIYTERIYIFVCLVVTSWLMLMIWRKQLPEKFQSKGQGWLPLLLWIAIPLVFWAFTHNIHENTMGIFILLSAFFSLNAMNSKGWAIGNFIMAALFILAASMSKGIPGFFPLGVPFLFAVVFGKEHFKKMVVGSVVMIGVVLISYLLILQYPPAWDSLSYYVDKRLLRRIAEDPVVGNRFIVFWRAFTEFIPSLVIGGLIYFFGGKIKPTALHRRWALLFFLIALSGIAPLALTKVIRGFYMDPALPFLALGLATLVLPACLELTQRLDAKPKLTTNLKYFSWILLIGAVGFSASKIGKTKRSADVIHDVHLIGQHLGKDVIVSVDSHFRNEHGPPAYFARLYRISIDFEKEHRFMLTPKDGDIQKSAEGRTEVKMGLKYYRLWEEEEGDQN